MTQLTRPETAIPLNVESPALPGRRCDAPLSLRTRLADFATLAKVRITIMVVATTWLGFAVGAHAARDAGIFVPTGLAGVVTLIATMIGTALSCMGGCALNQVYERDTDAKMNRTKDRPVPAGRIGPAAGYLFGAALSIAGVGLLAATSTPLAAALAAFTILSYVMVYTPMKRITSVSTIIGAGPGALPPVIGFAAAAGALGIEAAAMFAIMFLWQLPHFLAIAWLYREDYGRAGFPMLPVLDPTGASTFRQMLLTCVTLLPLGLTPTIIGMTGPAYFIVALVAGLGFLACAILLMIHRTSKYARIMFFASLIYLPAILLMMVIDRV